MGQTEITFIRPQEVYTEDGTSVVRYRSYDGSYKTIYNSEEIDEKIGDIETLLAEI
jgi:hypothetical protein